MILGLNEQDQKTRDLIKKVKFDDCYVLIGMEFQDKSQRNMTARTANYDLLRYLKYLKLAKKVDPIVTMTIFTGEKKWKNSKSIYEFLKKIPNDLKNYIPD